MSLINQMLRDLEQRNAATPQHAIPINVTRAPRQRRDLGIGWLGGLALIAIASAYLWKQMPTQTPPQAIQPTQIAPIVEEARSAASPQEVAGPPASMAPISEAPPPPRPSTEQTVSLSAPVIADAPTKPSKTAATPSQKIANAQAPKPDKAPTPRQQAEELYQQAQRSSSLLMTRENLQEALAIDPSFLPARTLLLQTLLKGRSPDFEIAAFADDSLKLFPGNPLFLKTRAHLHIQQKNFSAAVDILERLDADTVDDPAYLALLAAGYQQLQRVADAAPIYHRLTQIQPDKAENWLGLAMSLDKLNQAQPAIRAYRQALDKKALNAEVVGYINQRLGDLTR